MTIRVRQLFVLLFTACLLQACGGGGSSEVDRVPEAETRLVSGFVVDGPIAGARTRLFDLATGETLWACGRSGQGKCEQRFDSEDGHFAFSVARSQDLTNLGIEAAGGIDQGTGVDFNREGNPDGPLLLAAPLALFPEPDGGIIVSPLTTLLTYQGDFAGPASATLYTPSWLEPGDQFDPTVDPRTDLSNQRLCLLLTKLALHLGGVNPFRTLAQTAGSIEPLFDADGHLSPVALHQLGLAAVSAELLELEASLQDVARVEDLYHSFQLHEVVQAIVSVLSDDPETGETCESVLIDPCRSVDAAAPAFRQNSATLAGDLLTATHGQLLLGGAVPEHLVRFALYTYQLEDPERLSAAPEEFASYLQYDREGRQVPLAMHPMVPSLARLQVSHSSQVPLAPDQLIAGSVVQRSDLKRELYYASELSHLYLAKKVVWGVHDDQVNDPIMVSILEGEARAGRFEEARALLSQIYQSEQRGMGYLKLAEGLNAFGRKAETLQALGEAESLFQKVLTSKGVASFSGRDGENFKFLAVGYLEAGYVQEALAVLEYLTEEVSPYLTGFQAAGWTVTTGMEVTDAFFSMGDLTGADLALRLTHQLAILIPANLIRGNLTYKYRVETLVDIARHFADFGAFDTILQIWQEISALRLDDGLPANQTGVDTLTYMDDMAVALYAAGRITEAFSLIDTLPDGPTKRDKSEALKKLATFIALRDGLGEEHAVEPAALADLTAMDLVNFRMLPDLFNPTLTDSQVEALTYYNSAVAYIGRALLEDERFEEARLALARAEELVASLDPNGVKLNTIAKVNHGYAKLAELYLAMDDVEAARRMLEAGEAVLPQVTDLGKRDKAVAILADRYLDLGDLDSADRLLAALGEEVDLEGYQRVIEALIRSGDRVSAMAHLQLYADAADALFDPALPEETSGAAQECRHLGYAAGFYAQLGEFDVAEQTVQRAIEAGWALPVESDRMTRLTELCKAFAVAHAIDKALELAWSLPFAKSRNFALQGIAETLADHDDFPDTALATVDLDGDGAPDFFSPGIDAPAIAASGMLLDDDSDDDGVFDMDDRWPFSSALPSNF